MAIASERIGAMGARAAAVTGVVAAVGAADTFIARGDARVVAHAAAGARARRDRACIIDEGETTWTLR